MASTEYPIDKWKRREKPYCLTYFDRTALHSKPYGRKRYATQAEALAAARRVTKHFLLIDFAGAYDHHASRLEA